MFSNTTEILNFPMWLNEFVIKSWINWTKFVVLGTSTNFYFTLLYFPQYLSIRVRSSRKIWSLFHIPLFGESKMMELETFHWQKANLILLYAWGCTRTIDIGSSTSCSEINFIHNDMDVVFRFIRYIIFVCLPLSSLFFYVSN